MVRIRLRRVGAKKQPSYRVVVANQRDARNGRFIETIGSYDPLTDPATINIQTDRAAYWVSVGAQPSEAVGNLLKKVGVLDKEGNLLPQEPEAVGEGTAEEAEEGTVEETEEAETTEPPAAKAAEETEATV